MVTDKKRWKNIINVHTQCYDVPSGRIGEWFSKTLGVELDRIWNRHWNTERVIVFHMAILERVHLVSNARNICDCITSHLDLFKRGTNDNLVHYSYGAVEAFQGINAGPKTSCNVIVLFQTLF